MIEARGDTARAIPVVRESLGLLTAFRPPTDGNVVLTRRILAIELCATGAFAEGDSVIRTAIASAPLDTTQFAPYRVRAARGFCLMRARKFAEAEPLLLEAESRFRAMGSPPAKRYGAQTIGWLATLYEPWGQAQQPRVARPTSRGERSQTGPSAV